MKKSILAVLIAILVAVPSFAETIEVVGKAGMGFNSKIDNSGNTMDVNSPFIL